MRPWLQDIKVNLAISLVMTFATIMIPGEVRTMQPTIYAAILHMFRMFMKLVDVDPGEAHPKPSTLHPKP